MKKLFLSLLLLASPLFAGEDWQAYPVGPFGGLNNRDSSFIISSNQAQDLLNVDITQDGKSVKKRAGYAQAFALTSATSPVHGVYTFYDASGNDVALFFNASNITSSINGGGKTVIYSTATSGSTFQCADYLGYAYCVNSNRDALLKTNGVGVSPITVTSVGTMVAACPTRLAMAGFSGVNASRIDFSAETDFTTWGVGASGDSPVQLTVNAPGSRITHIVYAFGRLIWFKETSFGYILIGNQPAQTDWVIKTVSTSIGSLDNASAMDTQGNLYFRGNDGHVYMFDGSNTTKISQEITGSISTSLHRTENHRSLSSASDWNAGTFTGNSFYADTQTVSGLLQTTFPDTFDSFRDGSSSSKNVWVSVGETSLGSNSVVSGKLKQSITVPSVGIKTIGARTVSRINPLANGTTIHFRIDSTSNVTNQIFGVGIATYPFTSFPTSVSGVPLYMQFWTITSTSCYILPLGAMIGANFPSIPRTNINLPADIDVWLATNTFSITINNVLCSSGTQNGTHMATPGYPYLWTAYPGVGTFYVNWDNFSVAPETFTFVSAGQSITTTPSAWDSFNTTQNTNAGSLSHAIRTASTDTYTSITTGNTPSVNRTNYWQVVSSFTFSDHTLTTPVSITNITQNWFEGNSSETSYATFFDDKVWFSVAYGSGQTVNNRVLIYDLLFKGWSVYDLPANGFYVKNNSLYFGSSLGGYIYKFGSGDNDAGAAINSYWKSKDFFGVSPFATQELANVSIAAKSVASSSMTVTYTTNGQTSASYTMGLGSGTGFANKNKNLPAGVVGHQFNVKFGNNAADQPFEVYAVQVGLRPKSWAPSSN